MNADKTPSALSTEAEQREANKRDAYEFLADLENALTANLLAPEYIRRPVREMMQKAKTDDHQKHLRTPEDAFLYGCALEIIFRQMQKVPGIGGDEAKQALLSEYYRNMPGYCQATAARTVRHPFNKLLGAKATQIMARWKSTSESALTQSCPDFAVHAPFPFKIVFEGKYFEKGGRARAETELVTLAYQAFFYRALPYVPPKKTSAQESAPPWDYDYACLLAYDASNEGSLKKAWEGLDKNVRCGFWDGANVYMMILRGDRAI